MRLAYTEKNRNAEAYCFMRNSLAMNYSRLMRFVPEAAAIVQGSRKYSTVYGVVKFYQTKRGVFIVADITGLKEESSFFGFHIHEGGSCRANEDDPFFYTGMHYNPKSTPHPYHAGDLPPLLSANGSAFSAFLTNRFTVDEILGKTIVIHSSADDFTTQPAGSSGEKIACGEISRTRR